MTYDIHQTKWAHDCALAAAGVDPQIGTLRRVRRLLTTSAFPYLLAEAGS